LALIVGDKNVLARHHDRIFHDASASTPFAESRTTLRVFPARCRRARTALDVHALAPCRAGPRRAAAADPARLSHARRQPQPGRCERVDLLQHPDPLQEHRPH
ncbi:UNVERIFIED_CONTAM: hypothetical protein IGO34_26805, partial [Salmonella enterica subsp. enterica serovar Weltevreden]